MKKIFHMSVPRLRESSIPLYAESVSHGIKQWIETIVNECLAKEVHVEIDRNGTQFAITSVGGIGFRREDLERVGGDNGGIGCGAALRFLSDRSGLVRVESSNQQGLFDSVVVDYGKGCQLLEMKQGIDGLRTKKQGTRITVRDWGETMGIEVGSALGRTVVGKVRGVVQDVALTTQNVTFTVYSKRSKKFVYKSLGMYGANQKAAVFFGHVDQELLVPVESARFQGWHVHGYTVLPPAGHVSRSRQRVYFNSAVVVSKMLQDRIDSLYQNVYQDTMKLLPRRNPGDLLGVKRSLNAYPMFILYIDTENQDARNMQAGIPEMSEYISASLVELVESALLQSWRRSLSGRLLSLLHDRCRQVESQDDDVEKTRRRVVSREEPQSEHLFEDLAMYQHNERSNTEILSMLPKRRRSLNGREAVENVLSSWKNPHLMMPHANKDSSFFMPVSTLQAHEQKSCTRLNPSEISREDLSNCRIVGQVDCKFVAFVSTSGTLGLVDQHAADERIRLERLQARVFTGDNKPNPAVITSWKVLEKPKIHVGEDEAPLFEEYQKQAYAWGWKWEPWCHSTLRISVTHVPLLCGRLLSPADLKLYIHQLASTSACNLAPQGVYRVLASVACRSAIMFGDRLSMDQASTLVCNLSGTTQYYECAHGRPTTSSLAHVPLIRTIPKYPNQAVSNDLKLLKSKLCHHLSRD